LPERSVRLNKAGSKKMPHHSTIVAGIDVAKDKLDLAVHGLALRLTVANDAAGWRQLAAALHDTGVARVGLEATGGYERGVAAHLRARGFEVRLLQPLQTKAFARLRLKRAKNDTIDAALIAACTAVLDAPAIASDPRLEPCADLLTFIEQIEEDIARGHARLEHIAAPRLRRLIEADIARLKARRSTELHRLAAALRQFDDLCSRFGLVLSIPGIGERTAIAIVVRLPELGQVSREQVAALAGLAPFDDDSGTRRGQRHIAGGRSRLRRSLYAAALPAAFRWNPALKALYVRLTARGKCHKQALVACARKLLVYANTVVQRGSPWISQPQQT
jgi:transposase